MQLALADAFLAMMFSDVFEADSYPVRPEINRPG